VDCNPEEKRYLEDIAINGRIEMHLEGIVLEWVDCILLALSRYKRWAVLNTLNKSSMP
jgi:hypothetical protein